MLKRRNLTMETNAQPQTIVEETTQPQVETAQEAAEASQEITEVPKYKIKYNKKEMELPIDELTTYAQKGMNYDKINEELQSLKNDEALKFLDSVASEYGVSRAEIAKKWKDELTANKVSEYAEKNSIPEEIAKELLEAKQEREHFKRQYQSIEQQKKAQELIDNQIKDFRETYPDVKDADIPDSVLENCKENGIPLKIAYKAYLADAQIERIKALEEQLKVKSINEQNASSSMGSAVSSGESTPLEFTEESIKKMTPKEQKRNHETIWKTLTKRKE